MTEWHHHYYYFLSDFLEHGSFKNLNLTIYTEVSTSKSVEGILQIYINDTVLHNSSVVIKPDAELRSIITLNLELPKVTN